MSSLDAVLSEFKPLLEHPGGPVYISRQDLRLLIGAAEGNSPDVAPPAEAVPALSPADRMAIGIMAAMFAVADDVREQGLLPVRYVQLAKEFYREI